MINNPAETISVMKVQLNVNLWLATQKKMDFFLLKSYNLKVK